MWLMSEGYVPRRRVLNHATQFPQGQTEATGKVTMPAKSAATTMTNPTSNAAGDKNCGTPGRV
jgi:hypothetical protein